MYAARWVEYADKKVAKGVAKTLHMQKIGGKKRSYYADDVWTLKYLKHFTWSHLTEKKAYERRVRDHQLKLEMVQSKRQNEEYRQLVEHAAADKAVAARKAKKTAAAAATDASDERSSGVGAKRNGSGSSGGGHDGSSEKMKKFKPGHGGMRGLEVSGDLERAKRRFHQHKPLSVNGSGTGLSEQVLGSALGRSAKS